MPLRVNPESAPAVAGSPAERLAARAEPVLAAGDLAAYDRLVAEGARIEDPIERYRARAMLFERVLGAASETPADRIPALFRALAVAGADALEDEPREPILLNYFGVSLYELGALDGAERLFRAALRLDPNLAIAERNLEQLKGRRSRADVRGALPAVIRAELPALERRATAIAAQARPATGLRLSLCMIVRDEEEMLPRCLASVQGHVDEIVVVDTGSTDRTIEIARSFGAQVFEQPWTGSFAEARNRSFDEATGDWLLFLDADEVVVAEDAPRLRELTGHVWREAFDLTEISFTGDLEDGTAVTHNALRIFRNRPHYRFEGRLHEQIAHRLPPVGERVESAPIRVEHYGYLGRVRDEREKSRRNIELLERQIADGVDTPFLHFNLGSEHAVIGDATTALTHFKTGWRMVMEADGPHRYGFTPSLCVRLVKALRVTGDLDGAQRQAEEGLEIFPGFTDLVLEQGMVARSRGDEPRARVLFERCLEMGDAPAAYTATVGAGTFIALLALAESHRALGDRPEAERVLMRCLEENPGFLAVVLPLADMMLAGGAEPEHVVATIVGGLRELTHGARFMLGTALYEAGAVAEAEAQFRVVLERQPTSGPARVALAEALLSQQRYAEAAEIAAAGEQESPWLPIALRTELVCRMLAGQTTEAKDALERLGDALAPADRAVFERWVGGDGDAPASLPHGSAPLLLTMLEALLRLREVDVYASLIGLVDDLDVPWRELRETLAQMYLRRGFLESAADEWIAVCDRQGPDSAALVGLAQIAYARGMHDDARMFASEARQLDPENEQAERLAGALAAV